jgi:hypothetical protein
MNKLLLISCLFISFAYKASAQQIEWIKDTEAGIGCVYYNPTSDRIYFSGTTGGGTVTFDNQIYSWPNQQDISFLTTLKKDGMIEDVFPLKDDIIPASFIRNDAFHFTGYGDGGRTIHISKHELDGTLGWAQEFTSIRPAGQWSTYYPDNNGRSILMTNNQLYIAGIYEDSIYLQSNLLYGTRAFISRVDPETGVNIWAKSFPGYNLPSTVKMCEFNDNKILIGSTLQASANFDSISVQIDNKAIVLSRTDLQGNFLWAKAIVERAVLMDMKIDQNKNIYISGNFTDSCKVGVNNFIGKDGGFFILKTDSLGNVIWHDIIQSKPTKQDYAYSFQLDNMNSIYLTGYFTSDTLNFDGQKMIGVGSINAYVAKLTENGNLVYTYVLPATGGSQGFYLDVDNDGDIYWSGLFYDQMIINGDTLNSHSTFQSKNFLIKLNGSLSTGITALKQTKTKLFPNPNNGSFNLALTTPAEKNLMIKISNLTGQIIDQIIVPDGGTNIPLKLNIPNGSYLITLYKSEGMETQKLIIAN